MTFATFTFYCIAAEIAYYAAVISYDVVLSQKLGKSKDEAEVIDISSELGRFKAKDAVREARKNDGGSAAPSMEDGRERNGAWMETEEGELGGFELGEEVTEDDFDQEYPEGEEAVPLSYTGVMEAGELRRLFEENAGENFFRGIIPDDD